jgi:hypothetical protein
VSQPRFRNRCRGNAGPIGSSEGPRFQLRVLARAGSSTLNVSGRSELVSITYSSPRPPSLGGGTGAIAESRAAGAEQPALVARLIPMAARCAAPPGPTAGSQPVGAGSLVPMAQSLATEVWSAGRSSGSALCNLPRAVRRSVAEACWIREVAQSTNYGRDAVYKQAVAGTSATLHKSCLLARCCDFGTGSLARRSALLSSLLTVGP